MRTGKRILICLICAVFAVTLLVSSICIVRASGHICCGQRCLVCSVIARVEEMLRALALLMPGVLALLAFCTVQPWLGKDEGLRFPAYCTLVNWKIRLND